MNTNSIKYKSIPIDGLDIFYIEAGSESKPAIVLLHGFPSSSFMYRNLIHNLKDQYHLIAPTYPGFGPGAFPDAERFNYSFDNLSLVIEKFIDALKLNKFSLYIQDYGSPVGLRIISRRPELLECLIVQNANSYIEGFGDPFRPLLNLWENPSEENKQPVMQMLTLEATKSQYSDGISDITALDPSIYYLDQYFMDRSGNKDLQYQLLYDYRNNLKQYPVWQKMFREVQPPTLVVWGENDKIFIKAGALKYAEDLRDISFNFYPTGHFALEDYHEDIARKIDGFLKEKRK